MWRRALCVALCLAVASAQPEEAYDGDPFDDGEYAEDQQPDLFQSAQWQGFTEKVKKRTTGDGLVRARRWANAANGALLTATGPIALGISVFSLKLSKIVLSTYVTLLGGLLTGVELGISPIAPWVAENLSYLTTTSGRTALLAFLAGLTWPLGRLGLMPALLTCANAVFNANFNALHAFVSEDDPPAAAEPEPVAGEAVGGQQRWDGGPSGRAGMGDSPSMDRMGARRATGGAGDGGRRFASEPQAEPADAEQDAEF